MWTTGGRMIHWRWGWDMGRQRVRVFEQNPVNWLRAHRVGLKSIKTKLSDVYVDQLIGIRPQVIDGWPPPSRAYILTLVAFVTDAWMWWLKELGWWVSDRFQASSLFIPWRRHWTSLFNTWTHVHQWLLDRTHFGSFFLSVNFKNLAVATWSVTV